MTRPRAILFDWDNTLVDSWEPIHHALVVTFEAMGLAPWSLAETKLRVRHSLRDAFPPLFGERWMEARQLYLDTFVATHLERISVIPGTSELLDELSRSELYLAVVSNKTGRVLRLEAEHLGWTHYFSRLVGAGDAAADKPAPDPVNLALDGSSIPAGPSVWYVGDTAIDMECAANSGLVSVLVGEADLAEEGLVRFPPTLHFPSCDALGRHLRGL